MAFYSANFTLNGNSQPLRTLSATVPHRPINWIRIENPTGNGAVLVGDANLSSTVYGFTVVAGPANFRDIGPYSDSSPLNLENIYVRGTNAEVIHIAYTTL